MIEREWLSPAVIRSRLPRSSRADCVVLAGCPARRTPPAGGGGDILRIATRVLAMIFGYFFDRMIQRHLRRGASTRQRTLAEDFSRERRAGVAFAVSPNRLPTWRNGRAGDNIRAWLDRGAALRR